LLVPISSAALPWRFSRRYSDIDIALVTEAGCPADAHRVRSDAAALSPDWGPKLSVFWTDRHSASADLLRWIALDYLDQAVALMERSECDQRGPGWTRFGVTWVARHLRTGRTWCGASRLLKRSNRRIASLSANAALSRAICYSWTTGRIGSNDDAVAFLTDTLSAARRRLITRALQCRHGDADPDSLFPRENRCISGRRLCRTCYRAGSRRLSTGLATEIGPLRNRPGLTPGARRATVLNTWRRSGRY